MRKSNTEFHSKRSSGRNVLVRGFGRIDRIDSCNETQQTVASKWVQFINNSLLTGLMARAGVLA